MLVILEFLFLVVPLLFLLGLMLGVVRVLTKRPGKAALLAAAIGALTALVLHGNPVSYALTCGLVAFIGSSVLRSGRKRVAALPPAPAVARVRVAAVPPRPEPSMLERAWEQAAALASGDARIAPARTRCDALLARAEAEPGDAAIVEWAELIRLRVPELVEAAAAAMRESDGAAALGGELADALDRIGAEAQARLGARGREARDRFATLKTYVASRTGGRDWG